MKKGFTLIEVLIVVIILGILATLAIPQFNSMVNRARLAEAWAGLGAVRTAQAVYYMEDATTYADDVADIDFDAPTDALFTYAVSAGNSTNFKATANGSGAASTIDAWITKNSRGYTL